MQDGEAPALGGDGYDSLVDKWLSSKGPQPTVGQEKASGNPYDIFAEKYAQNESAKKRGAFDLSLELSSGFDKAKATEALRLSQESGIPAETLYRTMTPKVKAKIEANTNREKYDLLMKVAPSTAAWASNPLRLASDRDDLANLAAIEKLLRARSRPGVLSDKEIEAVAEAESERGAQAQIEANREPLSLVETGSLALGAGSKEEIKARLKAAAIERLKDQRSLTVGDGRLGPIDRATTALGMGFGHGGATNELGMAGYRLMGGEDPATRAKVNELERELSNTPAGSDFASRWLYPFAKIVGQMGDSVARGKQRIGEGAAFGALTAAAAGQAGPQALLPEEAVTIPAGALVGAGVGLTTALAESTGYIEAGHAYLDLDRVRGKNGERLDEPTKVTAAVLTGLVNAGTEMVGIKLVAGPVKEGLKKWLKIGLKEAVLDKSLKSAFLNFGKNYATALGGEVSTEMVQELNNVLAEEIAKHSTEGEFEKLTNSPEERKKAIERILSVGSETLRGMALLGLPGATVNLAHDANSALDQKKARAEGVAKDIAQIGQSAAATKLIQERPKEFERLVADATQGAAAEFVYVPVEKWTAYYNQKGIDPRRKAEDVIGDGAAYDSAVSAGHALKIPTANYITRIQSTEDGAYFQDELKIDPEDLSVREVKEAVQSEKAKADAAKPVDEGKRALSKLYQDQAIQIRERVERALAESGRKGSEVHAAGALVEAAFRTLGERYGLNPEEEFNKRNLTIQAGEVEAPETVSAMDQPAYHGSPHKFDKFSLQKIGTGEGAQVYGHGLYFAGNRKVAEYYKNALSGGGAFDRKEAAYVGGVPLREYLGKIEDAAKASGSAYISSINAVDNVVFEMAASGLSLEDAKKTVTKAIRQTIEEIKTRGWPDDVVASEVKEREKAIQAVNDVPSVEVQGEGRLYTVDLPEDSDYLSWDLPLSEQDGKVQDAVSKLSGKVIDAWKTNGAWEHVTGESLYKRLEEQEGSPKAASERLLSLGISGIRYADQFSRDIRIIQARNAVSGKWTVGPRMGSKSQQRYFDSEAEAREYFKSKVTHNYVLFDDNLVNITSYEQPSRGRLTIGEKLVLELSKLADASTFPHEFFGHFYLDMLREIASRENAPAALKEDLAAIGEYLGAEDVNKLTKDQHEKWARTVEKYLMTGKAPSKTLRGILRRFKEWLLDIYRDIKKRKPYFADVQLTPKITEVLDRLLATDDEIEAAYAESGFEPLIKDPKSIGKDEKWASEYSDAIEEAKQEAKEKLTEYAMRDIAQREETWYKAERERVRDEIVADVDSRKEYIALSVLQKNVLPNGQEPPPLWNALKLSRDAIDSEWGDATRKALPKGITSDEGLQPGDVASRFSFSSGDELIQKLTRIEPRNQIVERLTDEEMAKRHGPPPTPEELHAEAVKAVEGEAKSKVQRMELEALMSSNLPKMKGLLKTITRRPAASEAIKIEAQQTILKERAREIKPNVYLVASRKAGREAVEAAFKGDWEAAFEAKARETLNTELYKAAIDAQEEAKKIRDYMAELGRNSKREKLGKAGGNYLEQIDAFLERFDFRQVSNRGLDKRQKLADWIKAQEEGGIPIELPDHLVEEAYRKNWREMTLSELREVYDAARHLEHQATLKNKLLKNKQRRDLDEAVSEAVGGIVGNSKGARKRSAEPAGKVAKFFSGYFGGHKKFSGMAREMDGWKDGGILWDLLVRPMNEAAAAEATMNAGAAKELQKLFDPYTLKERFQMSRKVYIPELDDSLSKERMLMLALNFGNEDGRAKTVNGLSETYGRQITEETVRTAILSKLTKKDWGFVRGVWKLIDSYWPEVKALSERTMGLPAEKVEASPFTVTNQEGEAVEVEGGYFPLKYDPEQSQRSEEFEAKQLAEEMKRGVGVRATTRHGHRKNRVKGVRRPVRLDFGVIFQHLGEVIHDLSHFEFLMDANRILRDDRVQAAIRDHYGNTTLKEMKSTLEDVAGGNRPPQDAVDKLLGYMRRGTTSSILGFKVATALIQPLGITQSIVQIGPKWVMRGYKRWIGDALHMENTVKWIHEKSEMMANRHRTQTREISEIRNEIRPAGKAVSMYETAAIYMTQKAQQSVDIPTWLGAYEKALNDLKQEDGMTVEEMDEKAVAIADQAVLDSQGGGQVKDLARHLRGGPFKKLFTMFMNYFITRWNQTREVYGRTNFKDPVSAAKFAVDMLLLYPIPVVVGAFIKSAIRGDDDEDAEEKLLKDVLADPANGFFVIRELAEAIKNPGFYKGAAGERWISDVGDLANQIDQGDADEPFWRALNRTAGALFHYPSSQIDATVRGLMELEEGRAGVGSLLLGPPKK